MNRIPADKRPGLDESEKEKARVIDKPTTFWVALVFVGPFALPLLWRSKKFSKNMKIWITIGVVLVTCFFFQEMYLQFQQLMQLIRELQSLS